MTYFSLVLFCARRLWNHRLLMLTLFAGLVVAVGILSSIPLYSEAVHHRLLQGELNEVGAHRPPFAFLWRYIGTWYGDISLDQFAPPDDYLTRQAPAAIGLPVETLVRHLRTAEMRLFPTGDSGFERDEPLLWTSVGFISQLEDHIDLVEGSPLPAMAGEGDEVPVLISQALADQLGLQVDEKYVLFASNSGSKQIPVRIAGVWQPLDPAEPYWFYQPSAFDEVLLTSEEIFRSKLPAVLDKPVSMAIWYQVFDGSDVRTSDVPHFLDAVVAVEARVTALLNNTTLDVSPISALQSFGRSARNLTLVLSIFGIPVVGLVLYFIGLIGSTVVRRGLAEIAVLRSRGTTRFQIMGIYLLEGVLLVGAGLACGLVLGRWLAMAMGQTRSFLSGDWLNWNADPLHVVLSPDAIRYGALGAVLALFALVLPSLAASGHTIVTYKWERARALVRPLWQRYYLDILLAIPPFYGWYLLKRQGSIAPGFALSSQSDPFGNPLLFIVPLLFCFSLALLFARFFPLVMSALAWLVKWLPGAPALLAMRQLARSANQYTGPLLLIGLTLSLATFTASMASTLDNHLTDQVYYQVGADLNLVETGESTEQPSEPSTPGVSASTTTASQQEGGPRWLFLPVSEHLQAPGVRAVARVGKFDATSNIGGRQQSAQLLGVDRADLPLVAFFRSDFAAGESMGELMNRLAVDWSNILVSRDFMARNQLKVGDPLRLTVSSAGDYADIDLTVAGTLDLFPTLYPQDGPFFVSNLEYIYEGLGGEYPYDVWLSTDPGEPTDALVNDIKSRGIAVVAVSDARAAIAAEQTRPERQGLFGLLSVGFLAAAVLTVLGFLVYAIVSFQQRFIELGMLRAIGLSIWQMAGYLAGEQTLLILTGVGLGTGLGVWASSIFIPYLQVGTGKTAVTPPFVVQIAWDQILNIYIVFGVMLVLAIFVLVILLVRMKIFEAVKLGETA